MAAIPIMSVAISEKTLKQVRNDLQSVKHGAERAMTRGINRVANRAQGRIVRELAEERHIERKSVKKSISVVRATFSKLVALVVIAGTRLPLFAFGAKGRYPSKGKPGGVSYNIGRRTVATGFIAKFKSGHKGVFGRSMLGVSSLADAPALRSRSEKTGELFGERKEGRVRRFERVSQSGRAHRFPIIELKGLSVPVYFSRAQELANEIIEDTSRDLNEEILSQIPVLLSKRGGVVSRN